MCSRYSSLSSQSLSRLSPPPKIPSLSRSESMACPDGRRNDGTFKFGDRAWARVGSQYWPGNIFHPSLASKSARDCQSPRDGHLLVSFGDNNYGWYRLNQLLPFERYFQRMSRHATRDPDLLKKTVREALDEVWRWAALGLTCRGLTEECRNCTGEIAKKDVGGFFDVRVMNHLSCCYDRVMASGSFRISAQRISMRSRRLHSYSFSGAVSCPFRQFVNKFSLFVDAQLKAFIWVDYKSRVRKIPERAGKQEI